MGVSMHAQSHYRGRRWIGPLRVRSCHLSLPSKRLAFAVWLSMFLSPCSISSFCSPVPGDLNLIATKGGQKGEAAVKNDPTTIIMF